MSMADGVACQGSESGQIARVKIQQLALIGLEGGDSRLPFCIYQLGGIRGNFGATDAQSYCWKL